MKRKYTNMINFVLDNILPPALRDSRGFMGLAMHCILGKKYTYYMEFKEKVPSLSEEEINEYYSILADTFMDRATDLNDKCIAFILNHLKGDSVLDAASGRGFLAKKIAHKTGSCSAMDIVEQTDYGKSVEFTQGSLTHIPFEDKAFDTVVCTHALEHIKDVSTAVQELHRVCKKRLIIVVPRQREYKYTFDLHINFYPYKHDVEAMVGSGAKIMLLDNDWLVVKDFE